MVHEFEEVLNAVLEWAIRVPFPADVQRDDADGLWIVWETASYLAELIVCRGEYAPYRYVSFQLLDLRREIDQSLVCCYYDREDSCVSEILSALGRGIDLMKERRERDA